MAVNSQREDIPRISAESLDDWRRIKRNYTLAALNALDEQLKASNGTPEDRQVLLAHVHQYIDRTFDMARRNIRVNGQNLEDLNDDEDTEAFDEGFDRHIWSLADQSLRWDLQIARERRTKPEEVERQMRELLGAQAEVDAEEAAALGEVEDDDKNAPVKEDLSPEAYARIDEVAAQTFALAEELKQAVPVQLERSERVKVVAEEIKALKH